MEIRSFMPFVLSGDVEKTKSYFEKMGFLIAHTISDVSATHNSSFALTDRKNNTVHLVESKELPYTVSGIRINVDNFEEAVEFFKSMGFEDRRPVTTETSFLKSTMMKSPEGLMILVTEHMKK